MGTSTRPRPTLPRAAHSPMSHTPLLLAPLRAPGRAENQPFPPPSRAPRGRQELRGLGREGCGVAQDTLALGSLLPSGSFRHNTRLLEPLCPGRHGAGPREEASRGSGVAPRTRRPRWPLALPGSADRGR